MIRRSISDLSRSTVTGAGHGVTNGDLGMTGTTREMSKAGLSVTASDLGWNGFCTTSD